MLTREDEAANAKPDRGCLFCCGPGESGERSFSCDLPARAKAMGRQTERAWHLDRLSNREQFCCASGGIQHQVIVRQDGIVFRGKPYKSLSVVAYRITGTKWSGPTTAGYRAAL